ncbi:hypothetical protein HD806DRAFT_549393 [Xylariaceae sp. AK1471]|nr:hypothetical protein HD806DRAFT_549393 [Xylariaceae sp. AK1471]
MALTLLKHFLISLHPPLLWTIADVVFCLWKNDIRVEERYFFGGERQMQRPGTSFSLSTAWALVRLSRGYKGEESHPRNFSDGFMQTSLPARVSKDRSLTKIRSKDTVILHHELVTLVGASPPSHNHRLLLSTSQRYSAIV